MAVNGCTFRKELNPYRISMEKAGGLLICQITEKHGFYVDFQINYVTKGYLRVKIKTLLHITDTDLIYDFLERIGVDKRKETNLDEALANYLSQITLGISYANTKGLLE